MTPIISVRNLHKWYSGVHALKGVSLDADAVLAGLRERLAKFKQPKAAVVVDALPRNAMGKVQKAELRKTYAGWFSAQKNS